VTRLRHVVLVAGVLAGLVCASAPRSAQAQGDTGEAAPSAEQLIERLRRASEDPRPEARADIEPETGAEMPAAGLSPAEIKARIEADLGVEVLEVRPADLDGRAVYAVKVMNPPGNTNSALMVGTLVVDGDSGDVLGRADAFSTFSESVPLVRDPKVDSGPEMRRRTHR